MLGQARLAAYSVQMLRLAGKAKTEHVVKSMLDIIWLWLHRLACISCVRHVSC